MSAAQLNFGLSSDEPVAYRLEHFRYVLLTQTMVAGGTGARPMGHRMYVDDWFMLVFDWIRRPFLRLFLFYQLALFDKQLPEHNLFKNYVYILRTSAITSITTIWLNVQVV